MKIWTAKDLLYATLEFKAMVPNSNHWNENSLNYNKPRLIRLRRLNVLLNAFELTRSSKQKASIWSLVEGKAKIKESELIKNEITPFLNGDFIIKRQSTDYPKLKKFIEEKKEFNWESFGLIDICSFYRHLIQFRMKAYNLLQHNNEVIEASGLGLRSAIKIVGEFNSDLYEKIKQTDMLLLDIIDPKGLSFDEEVIIKKHGFPRENLNEIDMENY